MWRKASVTGQKSKKINKSIKGWINTLPTARIQQKQFHSSIGIGLFQLCRILMMIADVALCLPPTSSQAFLINSPQKTHTTLSLSAEKKTLHDSRSSPSGPKYILRRGRSEKTPPVGVRWDMERKRLLVSTSPPPPLPPLPPRRTACTHPWRPRCREAPPPGRRSRPTSRRPPRPTCRPRGRPAPAAAGSCSSGTPPTWRGPAAPWWRWSRRPPAGEHREEEEEQEEEEEEEEGGRKDHVKAAFTVMQQWSTFLDSTHTRWYPTLGSKHAITCSGHVLRPPLRYIGVRLTFHPL